MEAAQVVRAVRRRCGYSQRMLAVASGVPASTIAAIESGKRQPSTSTLDRILATAGLNLDLVDRHHAEPDPELVRYLHLSTSQRLWQSLAGRGRVGLPPAPPVVRQLRQLAHRTQVLLLGPAAVGVWLPGRSAPLPLPVHVARWPESCVDTSALELTLDWPDVAVAAVGVDLHTVVGVATPCGLRLDASCAGERVALRDASRLLHEGGARDEAGRRVPAHRDPQERREYWRLFHTKLLGRKGQPEPSLLDSRAWRLDQPASHAQWRQENGYPAG